MHSICHPRVACAIACQPWAIKNTTPTALKHIFRNTISIVSCSKKQQVIAWNNVNRFIFNCQQNHHNLLTFKLLPLFPRLTTPLSLRRGAGGEALFALYYFTFNYQQRHLHNCFTMQLGTSCTSDSPGLASESEGYPGSFVVSGNNAVGVVPFIPRHFIMAFHAENVQHLRRWPPHYMYNPG